ncbi:BspA family leucine-rich repeat surface protein [Helicobacter sp. MIT 03-1614]|nr:BspA family leucine-rich repeat surface protein [Helicobacter sp. MIT 03-1614]
MQNTQEKIVTYEEIQKNTMLKWFFDSKIKHTADDEFFKAWQEYIKNEDMERIYLLEPLEDKSVKKLHWSDRLTMAQFIFLHPVYFSYEYYEFILQFIHDKKYLNILLYLLCISKKNQLEEVKKVILLLVDKGANLNTLFYNRDIDRREFEPLVFDLVSDYKYQDKKQKPKQLELLRFLLEIGADPNIKNIGGMNLLHYAVYTDSSFTQVVIESGKIKDINERVDKYRTDMYRDETALHIAVFDKQLSTVKALINAGADVNAINKWGETPLEMSESQSISKIIQKAGGKTLVELLESEEKAKNCKNSIWEESEKIGKNKRENEIIFQQNAIYYDTIHNEPLWKIFIEVSDEYLEKLNPIYYIYTKKDLEKLKSGDKYKPNKRDELKALIKDESINLKDIDISLITDMSFVFSDSERKDFSGIEDWDMSKVTNTNYMFYNAKNFNHPLNKWDMSNVSSMKGMFYEAQSFNQPLDKWDTRNVTNMSEMFYYTRSFNQPLESWNVSNVRNMSGMFYRAESFNQPLDKWDTSNVTNMSDMFHKALSFNKPLENWNVSNVRNMSGMFYGAQSFNQPLDKWDTSNVTNMSDMFRKALSFNEPIESWDVSNVRDMGGMFGETDVFNQPLDKWDTSNVTNMSDMFYKAEKFNQPLESWNVSNVANMRNMFSETDLFNQPIENWDVSNVRDMGKMFDNAKKFNQPLESWNVSNVRNMYCMFNETSLFNQPLAKWDIKSVENMKCMFSEAKSFNQNLDTWDLSKVKNKEFIADRKKVKLNIPTKQSSANEKLLKAILRSNVDNFHKAIKAGANINEPIEVIEDYDDCEEYEGCSFLAVALDKALYHLTYFNHGKKGKFNKEKYEKKYAKAFEILNTLKSLNPDESGIECSAADRLNSIIETRDMELYDDPAAYGYADFEDKMSEDEWLACDPVKEYLESLEKEYE